MFGQLVGGIAGGILAQGARRLSSRERPRLPTRCSCSARSAKPPCWRCGCRRACLSTLLDDFSRYIIAWKLCTNMRAEDVTDTLDLALAASGCDSATVLRKPRLLSDNGPSYIADALAEYIEANKMSHTRGAPCHPQTRFLMERILRDSVIHADEAAAWDPLHAMFHGDEHQSQAGLFAGRRLHQWRRVIFFLASPR
jgi:transposase InsO family protein